MPAKMTQVGGRPGTAGRSAEALLVDELTADAARQLGYLQRAGVLVTDVQPDSAAPEVGSSKFKSVRRRCAECFCHGLMIHRLDRVSSSHRLDSKPADLIPTDGRALGRTPEHAYVKE